MRRFEHVWTDAAEIAVAALRIAEAFDVVGHVE
jgi:hypothetical protein